jgi:hypothetical protein
MVIGGSRTLQSTFLMAPAFIAAGMGSVLGGIGIRALPTPIHRRHRSRGLAAMAISLLTSRWRVHGAGCVRADAVARMRKSA